MRIGDLLKARTTQWEVIDNPPPVGETVGHCLELVIDSKNFATITCKGNPSHPVRQGTFDLNSECIHGDGFTIEFDLTTTRVQMACGSMRSAVTGSWTAEDTSGLGKI